MNAIWVMVADSRRARLFTADESSRSLIETKTLVHPASRLHEGDLVTDRSGRDRGSDGASHGMGNESDTKHEEAVRFAAQLTEELESGRIGGLFQKLYLVAAPGFLGILRKQMPGALQKLISAEVSKNMAAHAPSDIRRSLPDFL